MAGTSKIEWTEQTWNRLLDGVEHSAMPERVA